MTDDQINTALARWMGWTIDNQGRYWMHGTTPTGYSVYTGSNVYFNPAQRIDHAWLLVEHMHRDERPREQRMRFRYWFDRADLWSYPAHDAARVICEAIIEICEVAV